MTNLPPTPAPASMLDYSFATNRQRPGSVTAMGVISIVVACLTGLGSLMGMFSALGYIMMSRMPASAFTPPPPPPPPPMATTTMPSGVTLKTQTVTVSSWGVASSPATTTAGTTMPATTGPAFVGNPFAGISPTAATLSMLTAVLSVGIAIFLLIAGIQVLRDSPSGATLHRWYVMLKIPLVIFATAVAMWLSSSMMSGMMASMPGGAGGAPNAGFQFGFMLAGALIPACIGLAWPIALIFLLRSKSVRGYYNTIRE